MEIGDIANIHKGIAVREAPTVVGERAETLRDWNQEEGVGVSWFCDAITWASAGNA